VIGNESLPESFYGHRKCFLDDREEAVCSALLKRHGPMVFQVWRLVLTTARAALADAAGKAAAMLGSAQAAALVKVGAKVRLTRKLLRAMAWIVVTGAFGLGAGALFSSRSSSLTQAAEQPKPPIPAEPRAQAGASAPPRPETKTGKLYKHRVALRGRVLDPSGKPLAGAKLLAPRMLKL
jgi:hypothetical protein